jgi:hypothetical protein
MIGRTFPVKNIIYNRGNSIYVEKNTNESWEGVMSALYSLFVNVGGGILVFMKFDITFMVPVSISFLFLVEHKY